MTEKTTAVQIVMPQHCNGYPKPRLFGGQIMAWIDVVGAVAARRYTQKAVTTVCIDNLTFLKPAYLNDTMWFLWHWMSRISPLGFPPWFRKRKRKRRNMKRRNTGAGSGWPGRFLPRYFRGPAGSRFSTGEALPQDAYIRPGDPPDGLLFSERPSGRTGQPCAFPGG